MARVPDVTFKEQVFTIQQIICNNRDEFPVVVRTRNQLKSFEEIPIEEERKTVFIEAESVIQFARIRVLGFNDGQNVIEARGAEFFHQYDSYTGEEFYIPIGCPGQLRMRSYPGRRPRYVNVSQIMKDNPRYLKSHENTPLIAPRGIDTPSEKYIPAEVVIETKALVIHEDGKRYLKCIDTNCRCYFLREGCRVNLTAVPDERFYTLQQIRDTGILLPSVIQFKPGTISPYDVALFDDSMASINLIITNGPLEVLEIVPKKVLVAKTRQGNARCFKTVLIPSSLYGKFHVQQAMYRSLESKSKYMDRKFGGCRGDNNFIHNTMYLMPVSEDLVCFLRSPKQLNKGVHFCDSSDSDQDYEIPDLSPEPPEVPAPPLPQRKNRKNEEDLKRMHTVVLLPTSMANHNDVKKRIREKANLGFNFVHAELKKLFTRKGRPGLKSKQNTTKATASTASTGDEKLPVSPMASSSQNENDGFPAQDYDYVEMSDEISENDNGTNSSYYHEADAHCLTATEDSTERVPYHLTNRDFSSYTVAQTAECLKYCGLTDIANLCEEMSLDGRFFKNTEQDKLQESFKLSRLSLIKLRKTFRGWRPNKT